jgi:hypothetical protein
MLADKWYTLKINESFSPFNGAYVTRVPGGWIYESSQGNEAETAMSNAIAFIPYSAEF